MRIIAQHQNASDIDRPPVSLPALRLLRRETMRRAQNERGDKKYTTLSISLSLAAADLQGNHKTELFKKGVSKRKEDRSKCWLHTAEGTRRRKTISIPLTRTAKKLIGSTSNEEYQSSITTAPESFKKRLTVTSLNLEHYPHILFTFMQTHENPVQNRESRN